MKTCSRCKVEKGEAEFSKDKRNEDGLEYHCKACMYQYRQTTEYKESWKAYRQTNAYKECQRAYQQTDAYKEAKKAYRQTDAYKASEKARKQTDAYKEKHRETAKAYYLRKKAASAGNAGQSSDTKPIGAQR